MKGTRHDEPEPTEMERLTIFSAAELARRRRAKGLRLSSVEAIAYITDEVLEGARGPGEPKSRRVSIRQDV
jgi:urease gamma subunit